MPKALPPHWLDEVIEGVLRENNPKAIARAISHSEGFLNAIQLGLDRYRQRPKDAIGPNKAQHVRQALQEALAAEGDGDS